MSASTVRLLTALVLFVHGIGHSMALFPALRLASSESWHHRSWLLQGVLGDAGSRVVVTILFGLLAVGFVAAGLGALGWLVPHYAWRTLALWSALFGLVALALFWNAFASFFPNKIGAIAVNVILLWGLLGANDVSNLLAEV